MYLEHYLNLLDYQNIPPFLYKYLKAPSLNRLKGIGYFCGMDYASKDIYQFREYITRFDHSLTVALLTYKLTHDKKATVAGLFHDIATPCFSHVIDYMNHDYENQESTEMYTERIIYNDAYLLSCLKEDNIPVSDIINFKQYPVVDNNRPKLCADRLDGVILTGIGWTKNLTLDDITNILNDVCLLKDENGNDEIGFRSYDIAKKVVETSEEIDIFCHSKEDNYMMELLAAITKYAINKGYISYDELYILIEDDLFNKLDSINDSYLIELLNKFRHIKEEEIIEIDLPKVKIRDLNPLVYTDRIKTSL